MDEKQRVILRQAMALADEAGLDAVSMRAVGRRVGLSSMALYPYVGNKESLLDGLVRQLLEELHDSSDSDGDWRERLRAIARAARDLAHAHPGAYPLLVARPAAEEGDDAERVQERIRDALRDAGVARAEVLRLQRMLSTFALGYGASEVTGRFAAGSAEERDAEFEADLEDLLGLIERTAERQSG